MKSGFTLGNTSKAYSGKYYITPIRITNKMVSAGVIVYSESEAIKILKKIDVCDNIIISTNYVESFYSYKLCANADLIIAKHTSLADECLSHEIPVLFYEYTHNMKGIISDAFDYSPSGLMCYNFEELLEKSKSLLFDNSSKLKDEIIELSKKIYYVKENGRVKDKIIDNLENLIKSI